MPSATPRPNPQGAQLHTWADLTRLGEWPALVLGNGFSQNVWREFGYRSLREVACRAQDELCLTRAEQRLFDALETCDFEQVLQALEHAVTVGGAFRRRTAELEASHDHLRQALAAAIAETHVPHAFLRQAGVLQRLRDGLLPYRRIFTTNYDLLLLWASLSGGTREFTDHLNDRAAPEARSLYYLHGALYLFDTADGTGCHRRQGSQSVLDVALEAIRSGRDLPLCVAEGSTEEKRARIAASPYLRFANQAFTLESAPTVVHGLAFHPNDAHIATALASPRDRPLAVSIWPALGPDGIEAAKARAVEALGGRTRRLWFYDSTTHPLGCAECCVSGR